jgi:hypothetical protein
MSFFNDIDGMRILERNASRIEGIEMSQARRMLKLYKQARSELTFRLLTTPDNTFTEARLRSAMAQVEDMILILEKRAKEESRFGTDMVRDQGSEDSAREMNELEKKFSGVNPAINVDAVVASVDPDTFLFNNYQSSLDAYNANLRSGFERELSQALLQQKTWSQAVSDMEMVFNAEEWVLARIVRTELHGLYNTAKFRGFQSIQTDYFPDLKKTLYHPMDSRTGEDSIQAAGKNLIVDIDKPFKYSFKQGSKIIVREFMTPPDRPNDRSIMIPYRSSWE